MERNLTKLTKMVHKCKLNLGIMLLLFSVLFISCAREEAQIDKNQNERIRLLEEEVQELLASDNAISAIYDPCGDGPGYDEVILRTVSGKFIVYYGNGNRGFLRALSDGYYVTSDKQACEFIINIRQDIVFPAVEI